MFPEVKGKSHFCHVHFYNFDEIPYKHQQCEGNTMSDLRELFFEPAAIQESQIHPLNDQNYEKQDERIQQEGGLDAVLLGIGVDGHYCGNLPGRTTINDGTTKVNCDSLMKKRISPHFQNEEEIPEFYVTMGPKSIMATGQLILIANGQKKAAIMRQFIEGEISLDLPATILKLDPNLTVIIDREAASELSEEYRVLNYL